MKKSSILQFFQTSMLAIKKEITHSLGYSLNPISENKKDEFNDKDISSKEISENEEYVIYDDLRDEDFCWIITTS